MSKWKIFAAMMFFATFFFVCPEGTHSSVFEIAAAREVKPVVADEDEKELSRKEKFEKAMEREKKRHEEAEKEIHDKYFLDKKKLNKELHKEYIRHTKKIQKLIQEYNSGK